MSSNVTLAKTTAPEPLTSPTRSSVRRIASPAAGAANVAPMSYAIDPMLLVYEERVRTVRLVVQMIRRAAALLLQRA